MAGGESAGAMPSIDPMLGNQAPWSPAGGAPFDPHMNQALIGNIVAHPEFANQFMKNPDLLNEIQRNLAKQVGFGDYAGHIREGALEGLKGLGSPDEQQDPMMKMLLKLMPPNEMHSQLEQFLQPLMRRSHHSMAP